MNERDIGLSTATKIGYAVTAVWMLGVLYYTGGDVRHPVFDLLFVVPLGGWVVALTVGRVMRYLREK
jgi:hypothetical protein